MGTLVRQSSHGTNYLSLLVHIESFTRLLSGHCMVMDRKPRQRVMETASLILSSLAENVKSDSEVPSTGLR